MMKYNNLKQHLPKHDYINDPNITKKLQKELENKIIPHIKNENGYVFVYNGLGITQDDINNVIEQHNIEQENEIKKLMQEYIKIKNIQNKDQLQKFFKKTEQATDKNTFDKFEQKVKDYEEEHKNQ